MIPGVIPEIRWGTGYATAWRPELAPDEVLHWSRPREGSTRLRTLSGVEDAWILGTDHYCRLSFRWERRADWWSDTGLMAWLRWAQAGNAVRVYPNPDQNPSWYIAAYVDNADDVAPELEDSGLFTRVALTFRGASGAALAPVWVAVGPGVASGAAVTFSRTGAALYTEHT